jgi:hypothetical protein
MFGADESKFYVSLSHDVMILIMMDNQTVGYTRMMYGQIRVLYLLRRGRRRE